MDKKRNIELENWLIETTGEEMMANHLGPNWNRFHEECGFYPNISMTIADQVWEHKQKQIDELQARVDELLTAFKHLIEMNNKSISYEHDLFDKVWNQCAETTINNIYRLTGLGERALKGGEV